MLKLWRVGLGCGMGLLLAAHGHAQEIAAVDAIVEPHVGVDAPGIAVLVMRDGDVLHMKGYGFADLEAETPVDNDTIFDLASVSKQMTALAAMMLIADGVIAEDTPVANILVAFEEHQSGSRALEVGDLIHHLGGLPDYLDGDVFAYENSMVNDEIVEWLAGAAPVRDPGTEFQYSNSGYVALGSLVAEAGDAESLSEVLHERIWNRLDMDDTALVTPADPDAWAEGYDGSGGDFVPARELTVTEGDGNVYSSISDLALYEAALADNILLDAETMAALVTNGVLEDGAPVAQEDGDGYGFGWNLTEWNGLPTAYHTGAWFGTATAYVRVLSGGLSVIVLSNGEALDSGALAFEIAEAAL